MKDSLEHRTGCLCREIQELQPLGTLRFPRPAKAGRGLGRGAATLSRAAVPLSRRASRVGPLPAARGEANFPDAGKFSIPPDIQPVRCSGRAFCGSPGDLRLVVRGRGGKRKKAKQLFDAGLKPHATGRLCWRDPPTSSARLPSTQRRTALFNLANCYIQAFAALWRRLAVIRAPEAGFFQQSLTPRIKGKRLNARSERSVRWGAPDPGDGAGRREHQDRRHKTSGKGRRWDPCCSGLTSNREF